MSVLILVLQLIKIKVIKKSIHDLLLSIMLIYCVFLSIPNLCSFFRCTFQVNWGAPAYAYH